MCTGQLVYQLTFTRAIASPLFYTVITANEQRIANLIWAVMVCITLLYTAEVAGGNNLVSHPLPHALIKDKVLAFEFIG